jgi:hypothetical protein
MAVNAAKVNLEPCSRVPEPRPERESALRGRHGNSMAPPHFLP